MKARRRSFLKTKEGGGDSGAPFFFSTTPSHREKSSPSPTLTGRVRRDDHNRRKPAGRPLPETGSIFIAARRPMPFVPCKYIPLADIMTRGFRATSSAEERFPHTEEVTGSNPVSPTTGNFPRPCRPFAGKSSPKVVPFISFPAFSPAM